MNVKMSVSRKRNRASGGDHDPLTEKFGVQIGNRRVVNDPAVGAENQRIEGGNIAVYLSVRRVPDIAPAADRSGEFLYPVPVSVVVELI